MTPYPPSSLAFLLHAAGGGVERCLLLVRLQRRRRTLLPTTAPLYSLTAVSSALLAFSGAHQQTPVHLAESHLLEEINSSGPPAGRGRPPLPGAASGRLRPPTPAPSAARPCAGRALEQHPGPAHAAVAHPALLLVLLLLAPARRYRVALRERRLRRKHRIHQ